MKEDDQQHLKDDVLAFLKVTDPFASLPDDVLRQLSGEAERLQLTKGDNLFRRGDEGDTIYFVIKGLLEVSIVNRSFEEFVAGDVGPGMPVGEMQILSHAKRSATAVAVEDTELIKLSKIVFQDISNRFPQVLQYMAQIGRERLRHNQLTIILSSFFGISDKATLKAIEANGVWIYLNQNEPLFKEGDAGDSFYILISGRLRTVIEDSNGVQHIIGDVVPGECVGEMAALSNEPRSASIYAIRDSYLIEYSRANFHKLIIEYPQMIMRIANIVIDRLRKKTTPKEPPHTVMNIAIIPVNKDINLSDFTERFIASASVLKSTLHLNSGRVESLLGVRGISSDSSYGERDEIRVATWLDDQETKYQMTIYEADKTLSYWTKICLHRADEIMIVGDATSNPQLGEIEKMAFDQRTGISNARRYLVLLHKSNNQLPSGTKTWLDKRNLESHFHIHEKSKSDFQRLARYLSGNAVGLVLGGGSARGFAHIGVIQALTEAGIPIDMIGGTSMGAIIAAQYIIGQTCDDIVRWHKKFQHEFRPFKEYTLPMISILKSRKLNKFFQMMFNNIKIEDLWINYFCMSCNLSSAEMVTHREGPLWKAIRASSSLPGIFEPVIYDGSLFVDGGVLNNLPGDIMKSLCKGYIIAVNTSPERDLTVNCEDIPSPWKILLGKIFPSNKSICIPNISDIVVRSTVVSSLPRLKSVRSDVDYYFHPPIDHFGLLEFSKIDDIAEAGYRYATAKINDMKQEWPLPIASYT